MQALPADYLAEIARQIGFLSAFLGGFAATFLAMLLPLAPGKRSSRWAVATSAVAAVGFVVAVLATTMLTVALHPHAPANVARPSALVHARVIGLLSFLIAMIALLAAIGISGWVRSHRAGLFTSTVGLLGGLLALWAALGF